MKSKNTTPRSFFSSQPKLLQDSDRKTSSRIKNHLFEYTTNSTIWNDNEAPPNNNHNNEGTFTVDAIITRKNNGVSAFEGSKLIQHQKEGQERMGKWRKGRGNVLESEAGREYFHLYVQRERERRVERKFRELMEGEKDEFDRKVRAHSVNNYRLKLSDAIKQNKIRNLEEKKRTADEMKKKMNTSLMQVVTRRQQSLQQMRSQKDKILNHHIRMRDKRKKLEGLIKTRALTNLEERIGHYDDEVRRTNEALYKLKQKELKLEKKNVELVDQFYKAMDAIKKLQS